jgi:hypothetical protein
MARLCGLLSVSNLTRVRCTRKLALDRKTLRHIESREHPMLETEMDPRDTPWAAPRAALQSPPKITL